MNNDYTNLKISLAALLVLIVCLITLSIHLCIKIDELNDKNIKLSKQVSLLADKIDEDELYTTCKKPELNNKKNQKSSTNNDCSNCLENIELESLIESVATNTQAIQEVYTLVLSLRFFHSKYDEQKLDISDAEYIQSLENLVH